MERFESDHSELDMFKLKVAGAVLSKHTNQKILGGETVAFKSMLSVVKSHVLNSADKNAKQKV